MYHHQLEDRRMKEYVNDVDEHEIARRVAVLRPRLTRERQSTEKLGFVAQDCEIAGIDWAVYTAAAYLPTIYRIATIQKDCFSMTNHRLVSGDKIRYYVSTTDKPQHGSVKCIDAHHFSLDPMPPESIFVYGQWNPHVKGVDYTALLASSFAAIHVLEERLEALEQKISALTKK